MPNFAFPQGEEAFTRVSDDEPHIPIETLSPDALKAVRKAEYEKREAGSIDYKSAGALTPAAKRRLGIK